ncbi:hypothetical protein MTR62_14020 [Novosphingobium sp. 1949]|uniref:YVTN family beta-propeller protein n=1 Tax=Novosphingobium organovorum TaxID=2930092 RepID=A0ABT0BFI2_9SPHN|nr:hypothetical protein [Novosphingobium organovorum]MCJ2183800.1 hypothetical protein [Novosphingobium organovorum]
MKSFRTGLARPLMAGALCALTLAQPAHAGSIVLGGYPDQIQFIDDASGKVTDLVKLDTGLPDNIQLSTDHKKIYVTTLTTSGIEVLDAATHKVLISFSLNTPTQRYRMKGGVPDPTGRYFYAIAQRFDKEVDMYRVNKPQYLMIDLKTHEIAKAVDLDPKDKAPVWSASMAISPDGKTLYQFGEKVLVIDAKTLKVVDRIDLAKPDTGNVQDASFDSTLSLLDDPGKYVSLFTAQNPYTNNKVFGIARFDLSKRTYTFDPIGPAPDQLHGLQVTPDGKDGYTVAVSSNLGNQRCEFWHFDLTTNHSVGTVPFECRRRFYFAMSADGQKLYIYGAGYDVAVYDAKTMKPLTDWELRNDITMAGLLHLP